MGRRDVLGGSAVYFALAASRYATVHVNGIVGADTEAQHRRILEGPGIDLSGLVVSPRPTFMWRAVHDFERWVTSHEFAEPGCDPEWRPALPGASRRAEVLFVGSMDPRLQHEVIDQSEARLIGVDSMTVFIANRGAEVRSVLERADVLFLNVAELSALTGSDDWRKLGGSVVRSRPSARRGRQARSAGRRMRHREQVVALPATPVPRVVDPTGAGDALAGGFLGTAARGERADDAVFELALAEGIRCAADAVVEFGTAGLEATRTV